MTSFKRTVFQARPIKKTECRDALFADTDVLWLHLFSARKVSSTCQLMKVESVEESDEQNPLYKDNEDNIIASKYIQMHYQN